MNPCEYSLSLKDVPIDVGCIKKEGRCNYHKTTQHFRLSDLSPAGMCPEAYHNLHYASLGLLFNAKVPEKRLIIKCPGVENYVVFKAAFSRLNLRFQLLNWVKYFLYRIYPGQIYRGHLYWTVTEVKGQCPLGHSVGAMFYINKGNLQITENWLFPLGEPYSICPAVFDNLFPYLQVLRLEKRFPYSNDSGDKVQCPDHLANITFEVSGFNE